MPRSARPGPAGRSKSRATSVTTVGRRPCSHRYSQAGRQPPGSYQGVEARNAPSWPAAPSTAMARLRNATEAVAAGPASHITRQQSSWHRQPATVVNWVENRPSDSDSIKAVNWSDCLVVYGSEGWGFRVPSGAPKIKAVTGRNVGSGLDSFPGSAAIFQIVGAWCSVGAVGKELVQLGVEGRARRSPGGCRLARSAGRAGSR
jgi:hypothetical protein